MTGEFNQGLGGSRAAATDQQADMRLNGAGDPPAPLVPGGSGSFGSTPAEKSAAANTIETELEPSTKKAAEHADEATGAAVKEFDGWDTATGLKKVADTWDKQVKNLMGRLTSEKSALRGASGLFVRNDIGLGNEFKSIGSQSKLNGM
ncbi:hypothetical protein ACFCYI_28665 [Streptomyces sp. NPDC056257]|uniref:hypothetical protein n=1 Tax=Streptomyces sp. NPDC056257 TaxID=3345765 RepID=UPI0035E1808A